MTLPRIAGPKSGTASISLQPRSPDALQWDIQQIQLTLARRAYELFEMRNREHSHDWEDWFCAESELLRPVSIAFSESADRLSLRANVLGFDADELRTSIEAQKVTIVGVKKPSAREEGGESADFYPDQLLRVVALPCFVDSAGAVVEFEAGILKFELPRITGKELTATAGV